MVRSTGPGAGARAAEGEVRVRAEGIPSAAPPACGPAAGGPQGPGDPGRLRGVHSQARSHRSRGPRRASARGKLRSPRVEASRGYRLPRLPLAGRPRGTLPAQPCTRRCGQLCAFQITFIIKGFCAAPPTPRALAGVQEPPALPMASARPLLQPFSVRPAGDAFKQSCGMKTKQNKCRPISHLSTLHRLQRVLAWNHLHRRCRRPETGQCASAPVPA